ncbi:MAG: bacteriohemerythrin [Chromatiaceae bacterium]|nr:bacteriohemerythrin [Gammaproteobacteria bacterium]MCB1862560.1 bacteriohemerythrin [Gammaproteobacteria bacterium]MCB1870424.1 bacteriohemerythrin [Gammaproteobacteria bacterium]MCP5428395.1 bacteriohemerythrin [Chromatiaceae bacterium]MCP5446088.1 bacteriohemerythrin [Chromatiaceae bacterium]
MKKNINALVLAAIIGLLIVAVGLGFLFGAANPVPWILIGILIAIVYVYRWVASRDRVEWKESYTVGVDELDDDHKRLIELLNRFQTAYKYHTGEEFERQALNELVDYTKYHFEREEKMMEEAGYPDLEEHKNIHQMMIAKVRVFQEQYRQKGHEALDGVANFLSDWLLDHINGTDKKYGPYLSK